MSQATEMLALYIAAEQAVLKGQSFRMGDRWLNRAELAEIRKGRADWQRAVNAEQAAASGVRPSRFCQADFGGVT